MEEKELLKIIEEAARGRWTALSLRANKITSIPKELCQLKNLTTLSLSANQLTSIPKELCQLKNLTTLSLSANQLTSIPKELGRLTNLTRLHVRANQLTSIPKELGRLTNLKWLYLEGNQLTSVPKELSNLVNLEELSLQSNQLTSVPKELGQLKNLKWLYLNSNQLISLPKELDHLKNLTTLLLDENQLTSVPKELGQLEKLTTLHLGENQLTSIPKELGQLENLAGLYLGENQLTSVPKELGRLKNLRTLSLDSNQLTSVPKELGRLTNLKWFYLSSNLLTSVPEELGQLKNLTTFALEGNVGLTSPPLEIVKRGTKAILAYLREQLKEKKKQWVSKLLIVGEGGVGKTSLLRALRGKPFVEGLETTHGIGIEELVLGHPDEDEVEMKLNCWDFGGQQIYHATHQFFLTNRSLFVLVWDARHGWEAGKLYNWLDRIQAKAPESPVMIVAAHIDERDADLPLDDLKRKYPQIEGHYKISNKAGTGIKKFREKLAEVAADLPLMGEEWPASWLDASNEIRVREEQYISPKEMFDIMRRNKVGEESEEVLAQWLHELGDILYFKEDDELNNTVILSPAWVTEAISDVLESKEVFENEGILTRKNRDELWVDVDEGVREHFLRLMERFDLSYRTLENREISLVVECLPMDPPDYRKRWEAIRKTEGCKEISMKFSLNSIPAGIPTWFIARSHRFTTHTHWRMGALFADGEEERHLGLIETYPHERQLQLTVRGPAPQNFFALMRDGLELTLARFPGLKIKRTIPCTGHDEGECPYEFDFEKLQKAIEREKPVMEVQCQETFENVSVAELMFGLHWRTQDAVITRIDEMEDKVVGGQELILTELRELRGLTQREFLRLFNAQQQLEESHAVASCSGGRKGRQV